jgi:hypothetical protein
VAIDQPHREKRWQAQPLRATTDTPEACSKTTWLFAQQAAAQMPWGHVMVLLDKLDTLELRAGQAAEFGWSRAVLLNQNKSGAHERAGNVPRARRSHASRPLPNRYRHAPTHLTTSTNPNGDFDVLAGGLGGWAEALLERGRWFDRETLRPERDREVLKEPDLTEDYRCSLVRKRRQNTNESAPRHRRSNDSLGWSSFESQLVKRRSERSATDPNRQGFASVNSVTTNGLNDVVRNQRDRPTSIDKSRERNQTPRNTDRERRPEDRTAERFMRLAEVGVSENPGVSQGRTQAADPERVHA